MNSEAKKATRTGHSMSFPPRALDIIEDSDDLRTAFALWRHDNHRLFSDDATAAYFLLWLAIVGRKYCFDLKITEPFLEFLSEPSPPFLSRVELFVFEAQKATLTKTQIKSMYDIHFWYYTQGVALYRVGPYVTSTEISALANIFEGSDNFDKLSLLEAVLFEVNPAAQSRFDVSSLEGRRQFRNWLSHLGFRAFPTWMPPPAEIEITSNLDNASSSLSLSLSSLENPSLKQRAGLNLIGFAEGTLGIGEDLRSFAQLAQMSNNQFGIFTLSSINEDAAEAAKNHPILVERPLFPINLFCIPLFETERFRMTYGTRSMAGRYNIGNWAWELSTLPAYWRQAFAYIDEIWAMSWFLVDLYSSVTSKPVVYMPPFIRVEDPEPTDLKEFGVQTEDFVFLSMFDFNSHLERKNPVAAVQAFRSAFPRRNSRERLIVKTLNAESHSVDFKTLLAALGDDNRIVVVDGAYSRAATNGLIAAVDCFLSLHRSEGFGRVVAEAMLLGTPVIATAYSGSSDFLDETTGLPVDYRLVPVEPGQYPYMEGSQWAEPSKDDAIDKLRFVVSQRSHVQGLAQAARRKVASHYGKASTCAAFCDRLAEISAQLRS